MARDVRTIRKMDTPCLIPEGAIVVTRGELARLEADAERAYGEARRWRAEFSRVAKVTLMGTRQDRFRQMIDRSRDILLRVEPEGPTKRAMIDLLRDLEAQAIAEWDWFL